MFVRCLCVSDKFVCVCLFLVCAVVDITENILMLFTVIWTEVGENKIIIVNYFPRYRTRVPATQTFEN